MNDYSKGFLGVIGTVAGWGLEQVAQGAAVAASVATAAFMVVSIWEKIEARKERRAKK